MTVAIMQPYLFPYIGYWQLIYAVDTFVIFDDVNYIKKGYINRNNILVNGQKQAFTLELIGASQNKLINDIEIGNNTDKLLKTIEMAYKKAPHFQEVFPLIHNILLYDEKNIGKLVGYSLTKISDYLEFNTKIIYSSNIKKDDTLKAQDKIIDIAKRLYATDYINAIGGQELYDKSRFLEEGIHLSFLQTELHEYQQFKNQFVPFLSIIDIMMFNEKKAIISMIQKYKLI